MLAWPFIRWLCWGWAGLCAEQLPVRHAKSRTVRRSVSGVQWITFLFIYGMGLPVPIHAASHALLVGIGDYPGMEPLEGPVNDVNLMRTVLRAGDAFEDSNIKILLDENATKSNIVEELKLKSKVMKAGDAFILYFSGHGTSALDESIDGDVPVMSGALIPYDIENIKNKEDLNRRLVIGRRDLKPILREIDRKSVIVLVLIDSCYSGNAVRGSSRSASLPSKYMDINALSLSSKNKDSPSKQDRASETDDQYPYNNVYSLSAAKEDQIAQDIPSAQLHNFPTVDSKPHGAFTDSLVKAIYNFSVKPWQPWDDLSLVDLHEATGELMSSRNFFSTPVLLPSERALTESIPLAFFFGELGLGK